MIEQKEDISNGNIYFEVISNRYLMILCLMFVVWLAPKYELSGLKQFIFILLLWAVGDGLIHYRRKILNFFRWMRYGSA